MLAIFGIGPQELIIIGLVLMILLTPAVIAIVVVLAIANSKRKE